MPMPKDPPSSPQQHDHGSSVFYTEPPSSSGHTNALAESFFATLKSDLAADRPWPDRAAARAAIFEWIEAWYNIRRLHSSLGYCSPVEYEAALAA
ncbi:integrase core domain-containing protein [Embleya sp. NPDC020886]|uniref:integrase core domain-containing protein n=1 Tax=Embleya sp. NPDC020886 TaxID=3363980 RepID=UPI0037973CC8